ESPPRRSQRWRQRASKRRSSPRHRSRSPVTSRAPTSTAPSRRSTRRSSLGNEARIGVIGATGAVGTVTLELLRDRGYTNVRAFEHDGIVANPNCCSIPLAIALKPLLDAAGLARVRVSTYQSASGAGAQWMEQLRATPPGEADLAMDWDFDGVEFDEESKLRAETRKILELPELPISATTVRVPVLVGHAEAVWVETEEALSAEQARALLADAPGIRLEDFPTPGIAAGRDDVLVGRIRADTTDPNGLVLFVVCDNLRKGAALNAIQIAELILERRAVAA